MNVAKKITLGLLLLAPSAAAKAQSPDTGMNLAVHRTVQTASAYQLARPQITVGTRLTMFANFLQADPGVVQMNVGGTTLPCEVIKWCDKSVTVQLPQFGIAGPIDARLRIIKPNGRVVKSSSVVLLPQPRFIVHEETIPQPMPSTDAPQRPVYVDGDAGGVSHE